MSSQERYITVSLSCNLLILGYFLIKWVGIYQEGLTSSKVFGLCTIVVIATILVNIFSNILANILASIVHAIRTGSDKAPRFIEDERDKLINLKGTNVNYVNFSTGVLLAVIAYALGQPALMMISIIMFFAIQSQITGDVYKLIVYRRGV
jgi:hypothetical protein